MTAPVPALQLHAISKRFGSLRANDNISLAVKSGEILALLGENGAGKSTLVSILFGHYTADSGHIEVNGQRLEPGNPKAALAAGIGMVHQHFTLAENLTVLDNILLGSESLWLLFSHRQAAREKLLDIAHRFGLQVAPDVLVASLSVGERQRVELLKALYRGARILILDEPTAVLTPQEAEKLFAVLSGMVQQGLSIIFISHKLGEVLRVSHRIAVLRGGRLVAQAEASQTSQTELAQWMVGREVALPSRQPAQQVGPAVCVLTGVFSGRGREALSNINLTLRGGEITAIAGVSGNGQATLAGLLCGTRRLEKGTLVLQGQALQTQALRPAFLVANGVARIPEDRQTTGLIGDLAVWENAVAEQVRSRNFSRWGWIRRKAARAYAQAVCSAFDVRGHGLDAPARALSGGNMQKLVLGRSLTSPFSSANGNGNGADVPRLIVAHQPTWGLDIGAVAFVQTQLIAARDAGAAVLLISDDLDEIMAMGDQIAVLHAGHLGLSRPADQWTRETIGLEMAGVTAHAISDSPEIVLADHAA